MQGSSQVVEIRGLLGAWGDTRKREGVVVEEVWGDPVQEGRPGKLGCVPGPQGQAGQADGQAGDVQGIGLQPVRGEGQAEG